MKVFLIVLCFTLSVWSWGIHYDVDQQLTYKVTSHVDTFGEEAGVAMKQQSRVQSTLLAHIKCIDANISHSMLSLMLDNFTETTSSTGADPAPTDMGLDGPLGEELYFVQSHDGSISAVHTHEEDDEELLALKMGVVNQFQTHVAEQGTDQSSQVESDVVGDLSAQYKSSVSGATLVIDRSFDTEDVVTFADPDIDDPELGRTVGVQHLSVAEITVGGHFKSVHSLQSVVLGGKETPISRRRVPSYDQFVPDNNNTIYEGANETGFNVEIEGFGETTMELVQDSSQVQHTTEMASFNDLFTHPKFRAASISAHTRRSIQYRYMLSSKNVADNLNTIVRGPLSHEHIVHVDHDLVRDSLEDLIISPSFHERNEFQRGRLLSLAALAHHGKLLVHAATAKESSTETLIQSITAAHWVKRAQHQSVVGWLSDLHKQHSDEDIRTRAFLALGSVAAFHPEAVQELHSELNTGRFTRKVVLAALENAGVRTHDVSERADPFPYKKDYTKRVQIGGSKCNAFFEGAIGASTNLNCRKRNDLAAKFFNYRAYGKVRAGVKLFKWSKDLFNADAEYGKQNGKPLSNKVLVKLWGKTIFSKSLKEFNCINKSKNIFNVSPGFNVRTTIVVVVVPVTFSAGANLGLGANWGYNLCDSTLSAELYVDPSAELTVSGSASVSVLIARAGITISASYKITIKPTLYIHGMDCKVGFKIDRIQRPFSARLYGWYQTRKVRFRRWRLRITWSKKKSKTFWSYQAKQKTDTIYKKDYTIRI